MLQEKESFKRGELMELAKQKGVSVSEATSIKVIKEICQSKGSIWILKGPSS
jgi:hypothetical protein